MLTHSEIRVYLELRSSHTVKLKGEEIKLKGDTTLNKMKQRREALNITQKQLADQLGVTRGWINKIENGSRKPTLPMKARIAEKLNCRIDDIF